jgi:hypothetical protein
MQARDAAVLVMLGAFAWSSLAAQKTGVGCTLLTASEITGVLGTAPSKTMETDMVVPSGPQKGETLAGCMWKVGATTDMVTASMIRALKGPALERQLAKLDEGYARLRAKGWSEKKESISKGWCSVITPPASEATAPTMAGCIAERKGMGMSVGYMGRDGPFSIDKAKALFEKTATHVP